jgi:hypothetical protein
MLKQIRMKEWRSRVSQPRILREITNQMFTQPDPSHPVGSTPTYPSVTVHSVRTSAKSGLSPEVLARSLENGVTKWFSQISLVSRAQRHNTASRETHCSNQRTLEISEVSDNLWILRAAIGRL